jgi:hypothetical protein
VSSRAEDGGAGALVCYVALAKGLPPANRASVPLAYRLPQPEDNNERRLRYMKKQIPVLILIAAGASRLLAADSPLALASSDERLVAAFNWAKSQALAYAFEGDPVGPWYEAALPNREAFCMRDVSHQSAGAHALGLAPHTYNMLRRFAENIAQSRDWCSYWEINKLNKPAPVDYRSDAEFWYDLPANFDVLDACYRMYRWTGDRRYLTDPVFLNFYDRTVRDFVQRWDLSADRVMQRKRPAPPAGQPGPGARMLASRGIPSYIENMNQFVLGVDLLAAQYAGYIAYSRIQQLRGNSEGAREYSQKALEVKGLVNQTWWNEGAKQFYSTLGLDHQLQGRDRLGIGHRAVLYYGVADDGPKAAAALDDLVEVTRKNPAPAIEEQSHYPEIFYRYGLPDAAYSQLMDLTRADRKRREYPEVSYSVIGAIVSGMLGVGADSGAAIRTLPALHRQTAWVELKHLPVRDNVVSVREEENRSATLTNESGPAVTWEAAFAGSYPNLRVDGKLERARSETGKGGKTLSWVKVKIKSGGKAWVEVPK